MSAEATTPCPNCKSFAVQRRSDGLYCLVCGQQRDRMRTRTAPHNHSRTQGTPPITGTESSKPCPKCKSFAVQRRSDGLYCLICGAVKRSLVEEPPNVSTLHDRRSTSHGARPSEDNEPNSKEFDLRADFLPRAELPPYFQRIYEDAQNLYRLMTSSHTFTQRSHQAKVDFLIYLLDVIPVFSTITPKSSDFVFWSSQKQEQHLLLRKRMSDELRSKSDELIKEMNAYSDDRSFFDELLDLAGRIVVKAFLDM